jgi:glycosyltransferase involved in cell wall biosynthesis
MTEHARRTIMIVTPNLEIGGAQENLATMAKYLPRVGFDVVVCTFEDGPLRDELEHVGTPIVVLGARRHSALALPWFLLEMSRRRTELRQVIERHGVGVVQTRGLGTLDFLVMTLRLGRPRVQVWWTIENVRFMVRREHLGRQAWLLRPKRAAHRALYRLGTRLVNGVIVVSDETARSYLRATRGCPARVHVVPNGVDTERYPAAADRAGIRSELGLDDDHHVMTMVGTFKRQKGHSVLVDAMRELAPRFPALHVLLVGDGELRAETERLACSAGLSGRVHFLGSRRDVPAILAASDSFVLPSLWEGLPIALVEAMASGLPIVATEVSGTSQVMVDGATGWLVPPGDAAALADAVGDLLAHPQRARRMAATARHRVNRWFSARRQAEQLASLFEGAERAPAVPSRAPVQVASR